MTDGRLEIVFDRPAVDMALARSLATRHWNISGDVTELPSERDRNFLIEPAAGERLVLKVANAGEERALLELQHHALRRIARFYPDLAIPTPIPTTAGSELAVTSIDGNEHQVRALSWVAGRPLALLARKDPELLHDDESAGFVPLEFLGRIGVASP